MNAVADFTSNMEALSKAIEKSMVKTVKLGAKTTANFFKTRSLMPSSPVALYGLSFSNSLLTSLYVILRWTAERETPFMLYCSLDSSILRLDFYDNADWNCLFRMVA